MKGRPEVIATLIGTGATVTVSEKSLNKYHRSNLSIFI